MPRPRVLVTTDVRHHPVTQHIVIRWVRGLPKRRDECWFLMSSLNAGPARISRLYGQRMTIEEMFRDHKNKRNGWSLRDTQITRPDRLDRLILILALAYVLLCGLGLSVVWGVQWLFSGLFGGFLLFSYVV